MQQLVKFCNTGICDIPTLDICLRYLGMNGVINNGQVDRCRTAHRSAAIAPLMFTVDDNLTRL